ncbi:MAG: D-lyxose/D-mannose family sugar isomerase [Anaerolineae bacterium]|nr:D-lyxose/D-mannose family sugar isomerase [Anaerolineae bacterium]
MITRSAYRQAQQRAAQLLRQIGIALRDAELEAIAVADFGLGELDESGAQILTLLDTAEIAAKLIVLFPDQTLPEHRHPRLGDYPGKAETLRCEWGVVYVYTPGPATPNPLGHPPNHRRGTYTVWHETVLHPGQQITLAPNTLHWFQAGSQGCVVWSFSSRAVDVQDVFTDPDIVRVTVIEEEGR